MESVERILQQEIELIPEIYRTTNYFNNSRKYFENREFEKALNSLIELASSSEDYFSDDFWNELGAVAESLNLMEQAAYCKMNLERNKKEIPFKTPRGWTTSKDIDSTGFSHEIAQSIKDEAQQERWEKDKLNDFRNQPGFHIRFSWIFGYIYYVENNRVAEFAIEMGNGMLVYFDSEKGWVLPTKQPFSIKEKEDIRIKLSNWLLGSKYNDFKFY